MWFKKCRVSFLLFTRCERVQPEYTSKRLVTSQQHRWCWLFGEIGSVCGLSSGYGKIDWSSGQGHRKLGGTVLELMWWLTLQRSTLPHCCFIPFFKYLWHSGNNNQITFHFPQSATTNSTGQQVSLPIYLVCNGYMKAVRNGARLPAWLHCRPAINFSWTSCARWKTK